MGCGSKRVGLQRWLCVWALCASAWLSVACSLFLTCICIHTRTQTRTHACSEATIRALEDEHELLLLEAAEEASAALAARWVREGSECAGEWVSEWVGG